MAIYFGFTSAKDAEEIFHYLDNYIKSIKKDYVCILSDRKNIELVQAKEFVGFMEDMQVDYSVFLKKCIFTFSKNFSAHLLSTQSPDKETVLNPREILSDLEEKFKDREIIFHLK